MKARRRSPRRGASAQRPPLRTRLAAWAGRLNWRPRRPRRRQLVLGGLVVSLAAAGLGLAHGSWRLARAVAEVPVSRVAFSGELRQVDREALVERVETALGDQGFFTVDLGELQQAVEALPWVDRARVRRRWPDELELVIQEQQPMARWGDEELINRRGERFRVDQVEELTALPSLRGPEGSMAEVMARYRELTERLGASALALVALELDQRGSWTARLEGGVRLDLGSEQIERRAERFLRVYHAELARHFEQVAYVDLRYANGLAVGWKAEATELSMNRAVAVRERV